MKRNLLTVFFALSISISFSQKSDTVHLRDIQRAQKNVVTDRPPQAVYFQLGGSAPIISVNYDRRFSKKVNGLGFSAGLGFWGASGETIFSIPASVNYLFGRSSSFIELAGGATFLSSSTLNLFDNNSRTKESIIFYHVNLGYRHQPNQGGFFFRGGISPLFFDGGYVTSYYVGFGHNF